MKILKWLLIILVLLCVILVGFLAYMGVFSSLKVEERPMGPYTIAYESYVGEYKDTGKVFDKVYQGLKKEGIETYLGLGIYYDDPSKTPADKLRSDCGVVIEKKDLDKLKTLKNKFKIKKIARRYSVVAEFPIRNFLSYMIGPMKGYPTLAAYAKKHALKIDMIYELYDERNSTIYFVMTTIK